MMIIFAAGCMLVAVAMLPLGAYCHERIEDAERWLLTALMPAQGQHSAAVLTGELPRRKPLVNRQPWQTSEFTAIPVPAAQLALDPGDGLDEPGLARPYVQGNQETVELYFAPVYGQVPVAEVLESQRLAEAGRP